MPSFARSFAVDVLADWNANNPGSAVRVLFDHWCLPGEKTTDKTRLRLGLRDGYLNFYIKGQSVAKLSCGRNGPKLSVHKAYVTGRRREQTGNGTPPVKGYQDYDTMALANLTTGALITNWIDTADSYASAEKCFVDDLIAANPGVIDMEMGLPASDLPDSERVAPRMDLVVAQRAGDEALSICFWEAKCANNPELRASEDNSPKVLGQVAKYVRWMAEGDRVVQVQQAYRETATKLLDLYSLFHEGKRKPESVGIWQALAQLEATAIIAQPGIVIGNYWPEGYTASVASSRMAQCATSFAKNGHREKLQGAGIQVHEVGPDHHGPELPFFSGAELSE